MARKLAPRSRIPRFFESRRAFSRADAAATRLRPARPAFRNRCAPGSSGSAGSASQPSDSIPFPVRRRRGTSGARHQLAPNTDCDFECYFTKVPFEMHVQEAVYYGCDWVRGAVDRYATAQMSPRCW
jgi:hypothetical protein